MSTFLQKFSPTIANVSNKEVGAALPGVAGGVAGYAAWAHLFPPHRRRHSRTETWKVPIVGVLGGMAAGEVAHSMFYRGDTTRQMVASALGLLGAVLLPKYAPRGIVGALPSGLVRNAVQFVGYPVAGFVAGKAVGFKLVK